MIDLSPYLRDENAVAWLSQHLSDKKAASESVDLKMMYHLNLINNFEQNGYTLIKRLPPEVHSGMHKGGRRNVQASAIARAVHAADRGESQEIRASGYTKIQEIIGTWAEKDGCWEDYADRSLLDKGKTFKTSGSEANVYYDGKNVFKVIDYNHYGSFEKLLDRISIHNAIFPECKMEIQGFGIKDEFQDSAGFSVIVKQSLIQGREPVEASIVRESLLYRGYHIPEGSKIFCFTNHENNVMLYDIHDLNAIQTKSGKVIIFDCEALINDDPKHGGTYIIPEVKSDTEGIKKIDDILESIIPIRKGMDWLLENAPDPQLMQKQLQRTGRYEGKIELIDGTEKRQGYCVQVDPEDHSKVLLLSCSSVRAMINRRLYTQEEIEMLASGHTIKKSGRLNAFNLYRGRIDRCITLENRLINKNQVSL